MFCYEDVFNNSEGIQTKLAKIDQLKHNTTVERFHKSMLKICRELKLLRNMEHENVIDMIDCFTPNISAATLDDV